MELDQKLLEAMLDCAEFLYVMDEETRRLVYANRRLREQMGTAEDCPCYRALLGREEPCSFCPHLTPGEEKPYVWDWCDSRSGKWLNIKNLLVEVDGRQYRVGNMNVISDMMELNHEVVTQYGALTQLVRQYEQARDELEYTSSHDRMTGLYNRNRYIQDLSAETADRSLGILFFDLNNLKETNDSLGHEAGDDILMRLASSLGEPEQPDRRVYRIGGDEFVVLRRGCTREELEADRAGIQRELDRRNVGQSLPCAAAVGWAWSEGTEDPEALVHLADQRMYADKARRKQEAARGKP